MNFSMFFVFVLPGLASRKSVTVRRRRLSWTRFWDTDTTNGLGPRGRTTQVIKKKSEKRSYTQNGSNTVWSSNDSFITQDRYEHFEGGTDEAIFQRS